MHPAFRAGVTALSCFTVAACHGSGGRPAATPVLAITHVNVIPVQTAGTLHDHTVLVADQRIRVVAPAAEVEVPPGARVVDGRGRFLIPGLADMHEHLPRGEEPWEYSIDQAFDLQLAAGVTTIRSMRGAEGDVALRRAIERGERCGPRLIAGSPAIDGTLAPDPATARARVREYHAAGYDFVKILEGFDLESFEAMVDEGRRLDLPLAGHQAENIPIDAALAAPMWTIEHLHGHGPARHDDPQSFRELARRTAGSGTWICPTLGFRCSWLAQESVATMAAWPGLQYARPVSLEHWTRSARQRAAVDATTRAGYAEQWSAYQAAVRELADAGAPLLVSASGGWFLVPGFSMFVEFQCLADAGLQPAEILHAATFEAARCLGQDDQWGSIQPGLVADLVLLDADPLEDIDHARQVRAVVRRGRLFDRQELDRRLAAIAADH